MYSQNCLYFAISTAVTRSLWQNSVHRYMCHKEVFIQLFLDCDPMCCASAFSKQQDISFCTSHSTTVILLSKTPFITWVSTNFVSIISSILSKTCNFLSEGYFDSNFCNNAKNKARYSWPGVTRKEKSTHYNMFWLTELHFAVQKV